MYTEFKLKNSNYIEIITRTEINCKLMSDVEPHHENSVSGEDKGR